MVLIGCLEDLVEMGLCQFKYGNFLSFEDACYKANLLTKNGKRCEVIPVLLMVDD